MNGTIQYSLFSEKIPLDCGFGSNLEPKEDISFKKILFEFQDSFRLKVAKIVQISHMCHTQFPLLLTCYVTLVHLSPLINEYWYIVISPNSYFINISLVFYLMSLLCSRMPARTHYMSGLLRLLYTMTISRVSLFLMILTVLRWLDIL